MGWILVLECLLLDMRGHLCIRLVLSGIKWPHYLRTLTLRPLARYLRYPQAHVKPTCEDELDWADRW
jgi:hypothetical protein